MEMDGVRADQPLSEGAARRLSNRQPEDSVRRVAISSVAAPQGNDRPGGGLGIGSLNDPRLRGSEIPSGEERALISQALPDDLAAGAPFGRVSEAVIVERVIEIICPDCGGEGGNQVSWYATGKNYHPCRTCKGEGYVEIEVDGEEGESE